MATDIVAINRAARTAMTDDGLFGRIVVMLDGEGDETSDDSDAICGVVSIPNGQWFTILFSDYEDVKVH